LISEVSREKFCREEDMKDLKEEAKKILLEWKGDSYIFGEGVL
jgi:hypothetical protein